MFRFVTLFLCSLCPLIITFIISIETANAQSAPINLPPGFVLDEVVTGLELPTGFAFAPDGRIFITEKAGVVRVWENETLHTFMDLRHEVNSVVDRGLMSVAIHPQFPDFPHVYLAYVYEPPEAKRLNKEGGRVSRVLRIDADSLDLNHALLGSGQVILGSNSLFSNIGNLNQANTPPLSCLDGHGNPLRDCLPAESFNHIINFVTFGPDGALYVSNGDGIVDDKYNDRAQDIDSLAGKVMRIDALTGVGHSENPFYDGDPTSNRSKVYAYGMRNPFRFTLQPLTGELFVGEVGNEQWEEISRGEPGANFGWPCFEGPEPAATHHPICQPLYDDSSLVTHAAYAYPHIEGMGAAIGGDFYTGREYPAWFQYTYFFADFNAGVLRYLHFDEEGNPSDHNFGSNVHGPVQITGRPGGDLYFLSITDGTLYRIRYVPASNTPPIAVARAENIVGREPLEVSFNGDHTTDPDGDVIGFHWDFGDGVTSSEPNPVHTYHQPGIYTATLTANDARDAIDVDTKIIRVGNEPPVATIVAPTADIRYQIGDVVNLSGAANDFEDGGLTHRRWQTGFVTDTVKISRVVTTTRTISGVRQIFTNTIQSSKVVTTVLTQSALKWEGFLRHREHTHYDFFHQRGPTASFTYPDHGDNTHITICLSVQDSGGLKGRNCIDLYPEEVTYTFDTLPTGGSIFYSGSSYTTPFSVITYPNAQRQISTQAYGVGGRPFQYWSVGGRVRQEPAQDVTIAGTDQYWVANYIPDASAATPISTTNSVPSNSIAVPTVRPIIAVTPIPPINASSPVVNPATTALPPPTAQPQITLLPKGQILREWWDGVPGKQVDDLQAVSDFPDNPTGREYLSRLEGPRNAGSDYGARIRGYLHPPVTGPYRFWIASDDTSELYLSLDENLANMKQIAQVNSWTHSQKWDVHPEQKSDLITLEAGKYYYIEVLHKEADQKDNLSVAWQIPGELRAVIDGLYLSPFE